jgi:HNH endonuclease
MTTRPGQRSANYRRSLLRALIKSQGSRCYYCCCLMVRWGMPGVTRHSWLIATLDEKIPLARGGLVDSENCVAACSRCNGLKGAMTEEEFNAVRHDHGERAKASRKADRLVRGDRHAEQ